MPGVACKQTALTCWVHVNDRQQFALMFGEMTGLPAQYLGLIMMWAA